MAPKRQREDPNSYLGGDLPATVEFIEHSGDGPRKEKLTKAERNEARKQANKKWKLVDRKVGSGKDPNPRHTLYYRTQLPELQPDEDWEKFQAALVDPLPVTFRFGNSCPIHVASSLKNRMNNEFRTMPGRFVEINGVVLKDNIVKPIVWPGKNVWQIAADSTTLARNSGLSSLSTLLLREVELGHVVRQELASMIPALMLDVEGHHSVLDVCAAPGSKTEQLLSILHSKHRASANAALPCPGMVVANDADPVRINTLKRRYARCGSPNLMVTCSRAEDLQRAVGRPVFDRIVADVPCSGDGTIRKFPHIWRLFRPRMSLELHLVQLQIAIASVQLLKPGGRMVYSTCSINPLEDEAVVAGLLRRFWGRLHLVDTKAEGLLPGLVTRAGLSHWECSEDVFSCGEPDEASRKASIARLPAFTPSMRPPTPEEARLMHLSRCHRVLPQDNDTGGFFVAVLHLLPTETPTSAEFLAHPQPEEGGSGKRRKGSGGGKEVSAEASMEIMRNLGYNPKHTTLKAGSSSSGNSKDGAAPERPAKKTPVTTASGVAGETASGHSGEGGDAAPQEDAVDRPVRYQLLDADESGAVVAALQLDPAIVADHVANSVSAQSRHHLVSTTVVPAPAAESEEPADAEETSGPGIFGTKATGWVKKVASTAGKRKVGPTTRYCLVSQNVRAALDSWAGNTPVFLRQAGVAVADLVPTGTGNNHYRALPDAAQVLASSTLKECALPLAPADFKLVLKLALQEAEDGGHDADITGVFEQLAVLTAPDFDPEGASLEGLSAEAAELQVALATGLSADALQALGDAYRQYASSSGLRHWYLTCRDSASQAAETAAPAGVTAGASTGGGAEKRRLSKAERKKLKVQQPSAASAGPVAAAVRSNLARGGDSRSGVSDRGPEVLLLAVEGAAVRLRSATDLCRSYLESL